jgi:tryptophan synthase alpha subunit
MFPSPNLTRSLRKNFSHLALLSLLSAPIPRKGDQYSSTPIAVGFGIQRPEDVRYLVNKSGIAIIGSTLLNVLEAEGTPGVREFLLSLRP